MLNCPIVLGLPKLLLKESTIAELLPSASTFLNTFVICCFVFSFCQIKQTLYCRKKLNEKIAPVFIDINVKQVLILLKQPYLGECGSAIDLCGSDIGLWGKVIDLCERIIDECGKEIDACPCVIDEWGSVIDECEIVIERRGTLIDACGSVIDLMFSNNDSIFTVNALLWNIIYFILSFKVLLSVNIDLTWYIKDSSKQTLYCRKKLEGCLWHIQSYFHCIVAAKYFCYSTNIPFEFYFYTLLLKSHRYI